MAETRISADGPVPHGGRIEAAPAPTRLCLAGAGILFVSHRGDLSGVGLARWGYTDYVGLPNPLITTSAERLSGTAVFAGTRVPVQTLIDYLEAGERLEDFLADFPSVTREHAVAVLEMAKSSLLAGAAAS